VRALCDDCVSKLVAVSAFSRSSLHVMTAASIPAARGGDYARYLEGKTVAPERGDYYLTPDGELTQAPGRWLADSETLERLGIRPDTPMSGEDFVALMEGRHPETGRWLRRAGADGSRGGGIDGVSAPRSRYRPLGRSPILGSESRSRKPTRMRSSGRSATCARTLASSVAATAARSSRSPPRI
jgi:hypothetical protein